MNNPTKMMADSSGSRLNSILAAEATTAMAAALITAICRGVMFFLGIIWENEAW